MKIIDKIHPENYLPSHKIIRKNISDEFLKAKVIEMEFLRVADNTRFRQSAPLYPSGDIVAGVIHNPIAKFIILVSQVRPAYVILNQENVESLEIVAGTLEDGCTSEKAITNEVLEETSIIPTKVVPLGIVYSNPAFTTSKIHYFYITTSWDGASGTKINGNSAEGESIITHVFHQDLIPELIYKGYIKNTLTITGLSLAHQYIK